MFTGQTTDENLQAFDDTIASFEDQTGHTVNASGIAQAGQIINQTRTAVEGGNPPNVAAIPAGGILGMIDNDLLEPVGERLDNSDQLDRSDFTRERKFDIASLNGDTVYGIPFMSGHWGSLYYNADMLEDTGYDPMEPNFKTWPEFMEVANEVKDAVGVQPVGFSGADHIHSTVQWHGFFATTGTGSWLNEDQSSTVLNEDQGISTAQVTQQAVDDDLLPDGVVNQNALDFRELFKSEQLFAYQTGSWEAAALRESDVNWGITYNPQAPNGEASGFSGGWFFIIPRGADNVDESWQLIEHLMQVENLSAYAGLPPILTDGLENVFDGFQDGLGRDVGDIFVEEILNASFPTIHPNQGRMWERQREELQQLLLGNKNAEQAMNDLDSAITDLL
jgi:ABC-type glycerol-3-phosphate transport system substrate-binding protein